MKKVEVFLLEFVEFYARNFVFSIIFFNVVTPESA